MAKKIKIKNTMAHSLVKSLIFSLVISLVFSAFFSLYWFFLKPKETKGLLVEIPPELREGVQITFNIPFIYFTRYFPTKKEPVTFTLQINSLLRKENMEKLLEIYKSGVHVEAEYALPSNFKFYPNRVVTPTLYLKTLGVFGPIPKAKKYTQNLSTKLTRQLFSLLKIKVYYGRVHVQNLLYLRERIQRKIEELNNKISFLAEVGKKYGNREGPNLATSVEPYFLAYLSPTLQARASTIIIHELQTDMALLNNEVDYFNKYAEFYGKIQNFTTCEKAEIEAKTLFPSKSLSRIMGELERDCLLPRAFTVSLPIPPGKRSLKSAIIATIIFFLFSFSISLVWFSIKNEE